MNTARRRIFHAARVVPIAVSALGCALLVSSCGTGSTGGAIGSGGGTGGGTNGGTGAGRPVVLRDSANHTTVHVAAGSEVELLLSSDYWRVGGSSARSVLTQDGDTRTLPRPSDCPVIPGNGCTPEATLFRALAPGTAVITASRTTCGEAMLCPGDQRSFSVTVVVG